jgi:hypothetical protein
MQSTKINLVNPDARFKKNFALFYMGMNYPFLTYIKDNADILSTHSPFYGAPFTINLFNFDPSMYYGFSNSTIIHPFISFISGSFAFISKYLGNHLFFLVIQSVVNAINVVMIFYYLRIKDTRNIVPFLFAIFFGISSYNIFTSLIPDSYTYAQSFIILSVLYLQYSRVQSRTSLVSLSSLALLNFAITSTNITTFISSLFISIIDRNDKNTFINFLRIVFIFLLLVVLFTWLQFSLFDGHSWISNWLHTVNTGGFSYVSKLSVSQHWKAIYMLVISPILTPDIILVDPGIVAFVTDLTRPYPFYVHIFGSSFIVMAILGFIKGFKTRENWVLVTYILFALILHIIVGYGLAEFKYDLYLYAGHYLFALFLLSAKFILRIKRDIIRTALIGIIVVFILTTLTNNIIKHTDALQYIEQSYIHMEHVGKD